MRYISFILSLIPCVLILSSCSTKLSQKNGLFDQVYVLNLDRTPDRYLEAKDNLEKSGVDHIRFSATDGYKVQVKDLINKKQYDGRSMWTSCKDFREKGKFLYEVECDADPRNNIVVNSCATPGEIGVFCSMKRIWRDIYDKGYSRVLILEDDARILPKYKHNFKDKVADIVHNTPIDGDVLFLHLYYRHNKTYPARKIGTKLENQHVWGINRDPEYSVASCAAYIVNRGFVSKMLQFTDVMDQPIDLKIGDAINKRFITGYKAKEKLILPDEKEEKSVIKQMGRNENGELLN
jgi:GR25 family glycosyltransferase involved in LPS biosynthesis